MRDSPLYCAALFVFAFPGVSNGQSGLTYDLVIKERVGTETMESRGTAMVSGSNVRLDLVGPTSLSRVRALSFGDSISLIASGTGFGEVRDIIGHKTREYVEYMPWRAMAAARDRIGYVPEVRMPVFGGKVTLDSLGPGEVINGFATIHYRLAVSVRIDQRGAGGRTFVNEQVSDFYIAPELAEFAAGTRPWNAAEQAGLVFGANPMVPRSFLNELDAASNRLTNGLVLKVEMAGHATMPGTLRLSVEVKNIKRVDLPTDTFFVPVAYKKLSLPGLDN